jgi:hypothetical protein
LTAEKEKEKVEKLEEEHHVLRQQSKASFADITNHTAAIAMKAAETPEYKAEMRKRSRARW